jgi:hypothetical protein
MVPVWVSSLVIYVLKEGKLDQPFKIDTGSINELI